MIRTVFRGAKAPSNRWEAGERLVTSAVLSGVMMVLMASSVLGSTVFDQGFEGDTSGIIPYPGLITRVASGGGTLSVPSATGGFHAEVALDGAYGDGWYTWNGGSSSTWPGYIKQSIKVYIDPAAGTVGDGWFWDPAVNKETGFWGRGGGFGVQKTATGTWSLGAEDDYGGFDWVGHTGWSPLYAYKTPPLDITVAGWYTLATVWKKSATEDRVDQVDTIRDASGTLLWTDTIPGVMSLTPGQDDSMGGISYSWLGSQGPNPPDQIISPRTGNPIVSNTMTVLAIDDVYAEIGAPETVWVDDDYSEGSSGGHIWGIDAFATIQGGVNAVAAGGTVNVAAGTYAERLNVNKPLTLSGAGVGLSVIDATSFGTAGDVIDITAKTGNTKIEGFDIKTGDLSNGITSSGGTDVAGKIEILNNHIISTDYNEPQFGIIAGYGDVRTLIISGNEISNTYDNSILAELQMGETQITGNRLNGAYPSIFFMTYDGNSVTRRQLVSGNAIDMSTADADTECKGITFNPDTAYVEPALRTGRYHDVVISNNTITGLGDPTFKGIRIGESSVDGSGGFDSLGISGNTVSGTNKNGNGIRLDGHITLADIHNNIFTGLSQGIHFDGTSFGSLFPPTGTIFFPENNKIDNNQITGASVGILLHGSDNSVTCNQITLNDIGIETLQPPSGSGVNTIANNSIHGNTLGMRNDDSPGVVVDATNNYWGKFDGPDAGPDTGSGDPVGPDITFAPFLVSVPSCVIRCDSDSDCSDRCLTGVCLEPSGTCEPRPAGAPCDCGTTDCPAPDACDGTGMCLSPTSLNVKYARVTVTKWPTKNTGSVAVRAVVDDSDTGGDLKAKLLAGAVSLQVQDSGVFNTTVSLTGCHVWRRGTVLCRSSDRTMSARFTPLTPRRTPNRYLMRVARKRLGVGETGYQPPTGPLTVTLHQGVLTRLDDMSSCKLSRLKATMVCRGS